MGKKKMRAKYVSKGVQGNMSKKLTNAVAAERTEVEKALNKQKAYLSGKSVWITIENPAYVPKTDKHPGQNTNKRFIRVRAREYYGDPKTRNYVMPGTGEAKDKKKKK